MKSIILPFLMGGALLTISCGEKKSAPDSNSSTDTDQDSLVDKAVGLANDVVKKDADSGKEEETIEAPKVSLEELAKKTGFAQNLPTDIEGYLSIINMNDTYERMLKSKVGVLIQETAAAQGVDIEKEMSTPEAEMVRAILGEEVFFAFGKDSGKQAGLLQGFSSSMNYHQMKMLVELAAMGISGEEPEDFLNRGPAFFSGFLGDPKAGIATFEKAELPPITMGFKVSDEDMREQLSGMISGYLAMAMEFGMGPIEELTLEKSGVKLSGITVVGKSLAEMVEEGREEASQFLGGEAEFERLKKAIAAKNLYAATGTFGDYVLIYIGGSMEGFKLADKVDDSMLAHKDADFLKFYADKDLRLISFTDEGAVNAITATSEAFGSMARGIKDGLAEAEVFGDTRDIQTLLGHISKVEKELFQMGDYTSQGVVGFFEEGFKIESHGGSSLPHADLEVPHTFTSLGKHEGVFLYANSVSNPGFTAKLGDYIDSIGETAYLVAKQASELEIDDHDFEEFKQGFDLFDQLAAKDLAQIWSAITNDFADGTGNESALVIDLKGTLPTVPKVPSVVIEKGLIPRVALIMPVTDRKKVGASWEKINESVTRLLKSADEMDLFTLPMQEPMESSKDGVSTYFFPIPTITKDANPNISVSDKHFIASTSPKFNGELLGSLGAEDAPERKGSYLQVDFVVLQDFVKHWVALAKDNADDFFDGNERDKEEFLENLPLIEKVIAAFDDLQTFTVHTRNEGGEVRSTLHFKTK